MCATRVFTVAWSNLGIHSFVCIMHIDLSKLKAFYLIPLKLNFDCLKKSAARCWGRCKKTSIRQTAIERSGRMEPPLSLWNLLHWLFSVICHYRCMIKEWWCPLTPEYLLTRMRAGTALVALFLAADCHSKKVWSLCGPINCILSLFFCFFNVFLASVVVFFFQKSQQL